VSGTGRFRLWRLVVALGAAVFLPLVWAPTVNAGATTRPATTPTTVEIGARSAAAPNTGSSQGGLPFTGGDVMAVGLIGVGMLLSGISLSGGRRHRYPYSRFVDS
jgi:hypothetical protein